MTTTASLTEEAATAAIVVACRELKLPTVAAEATRLADLAMRERFTHRAYLAALLAAEVDERTSRRIARRISEARFPRTKRLADFDCTLAPSVSPTTIATLAAGAYLASGDPVVLLGDSGTGKTHLLIGLGIAACEAGCRVRYTTTAALVNELVEAAAEHRLSRVVGHYARLDLLCLDEFGYVQFDPRGAELLFQVLTAREERASIAVASNASFSEWGSFFTDARLAAAVVDRLTFRAHIIETGSDSYRLRFTKLRHATAPAKRSALSQPPKEPAGAE
ncbi:MAG: IS21-like element helper ATPase IstB [Chloroflexota bacterium]|nr:IS21-like element helper ATPase IstB [Chloroflexota bacterium]